METHPFGSERNHSRQNDLLGVRDRRPVTDDIPFRWKRDGQGWRLFVERRRFGRLVPDSNYPGMWRNVLPDGRLSDMANLSWARHAAQEVARREIEWRRRQTAATDARNCPESAGVFGGKSSPMRRAENSDPGITKRQTTLLAPSAP